MGCVSKAGGWIATLARAARITWVALACVLAYTLGSLRRLTIRDRARRASHRAHQRGRLLRWSFARLGATFIKVGQVMSSRSDLFSPGIIAELRSLQDRVPPFPFTQVRQIVERELGAPLDRRFRAFCPTSIAAGSVAQVHRAVLRNGDVVAVKVLRPDVVCRARRDGRILLWLAHTAHVLSARARVANVVAHTRDLVAGILQQTDLSRERVNYERFRRNFAGTPGLAFPRVYRRYSTRSMLTMEYIEGTHVDATQADHLPGAARVIRSMFFAMCFDHGFVHADLHPGNVLIRPAGDVVILDVGLVKRIPKSLMLQVGDFTRCLAGGDARDLVGHLRRFHRYLDDTDWVALEADARTFIASVRAKPILQLELGAIVGELFALARKHHIHPMPDMALILLGMVTSEGMAKRLDPDLDTFAALGTYLGPRNAPRTRLARGSRTWLPDPNAQGVATPALTPALPTPALPAPAQPTPPPTGVLCRPPTPRRRRPAARPPDAQRAPRRPARH